MYTYLLYYKAGSSNYNSEYRRLLSFNREIANFGDIRHIENELSYKLGVECINLLSFSILKEPYDEYIYSLDEEWK